MEQIVVSRKDGTTYSLRSKKDVVAIKSAQQTCALLGDDVVNITIESPTPQRYDIGDNFTVFGRHYTLNQLPRVQKNGAHSYTYELTFEGVQYDLMRAMYDVSVETTKNTLQDLQGDTLTGDLSLFAKVLQANVQRVLSPFWRVDLENCPQTEADKTLTFGDSDNCLAVLQNLCKEFEVEFEIKQPNGNDQNYTISFKKKVGHTHDITFEYGKGKGLYAIDRQNVDSSNIVTRLRVYGSSENLTNKYRADRLCLPEKSRSQSFIEDENATRKFGIHEVRKTFDDVKPTFTGRVTGIVDSDITQFIAKNMPFDLNEKDGKTTKYLIAGTSAKIHFNTGKLAGMAFEIHTYDHVTQTFVIKAADDGKGFVFPSKEHAEFRIGVGDTFKLLDITYPEDIIAQAEQRLQAKAEEYYTQNSQPKVKYGVSVSKAFIKKLFGGSSAATATLFAPGDYIKVRDEIIGVDKAVRIQSFQRNLLDPYEYTLTIADEPASNITTRVISELVEINKITTTNRLKDPIRARANWRTSRELLNMVFDPEGDYYTDKIKPNSIDTLALSVGAKSMQFSLQDVVFEPNFRGSSNTVRVSSGTLTHYAIESEIKSWKIFGSDYELEKPQTPYYIYARCTKVGNSAVIVFSESPKQVEEESDYGYYHFWIGVINSVHENARAISLTYGFSTINGRFIKTGRIVGENGTYFDLDEGVISGRIQFEYDGGVQDMGGYVEQTRGELGRKNRVFTSEPTPPYQVGDLWTNEGELYRCKEARLSGGYVANDWEKAVAYDNTKTTIEGGLVTSGTMQVAGNEHTILAGITGKGTEDDSVRFWAGAPFENRANAPFRVSQDGTTHMTKANVTGTINATSGKIGGFDINRQGIGVDNENDNAEGLSLTDNQIRFRRGDTYASIGKIGFLGYSMAARFELESSHNNDIIGAAVYAKCRAGDGALDYWFPQRALQYSGNVYGIGKKCEFSTGYIGEVFTDIIEARFHLTHCYHFTECKAKNRALNLPTKEKIDKQTDGKDVIFNIEIMCDRTMPNRIVIESRDGAQIYNNDGVAIPNLSLEKGDGLCLRYYNGGYHVLFKQYTT